MFKFLRVVITHGIALGIGFALGIYLLPVLIAPEAPSDEAIRSSIQQANFRATFTRELPGSDFLHWGEGEISISATRIGFTGALAESARVGAVKTFDNFLLDIPPGIDPAEYRAVVVWCETFSEFITAASYR